MIEPYLMHLSKVGEFIVDLYESKDGQCAAAIVDPTTDKFRTPDLGGKRFWLSPGESDEKTIV